MIRETTDEPASAGSDKVAIRRWTVCAARDAKPCCVAFRRPAPAACFGHFLGLHSVFFRSTQRTSTAAVTSSDASLLRAAAINVSAREALSRRANNVASTASDGVLKSPSQQTRKISPAAGTVDFVQYQAFRIRLGGARDDVRVRVMRGPFSGDRGAVAELLDQNMISRKLSNGPVPGCRRGAGRSDPGLFVGAVTRTWIFWRGQQRPAAGHGAMLGARLGEDVRCQCL